VSRKILVKLIAASFALVGMESAMACSIAAWTNTGAGGGATGTPLAGEPDDATPVARYSGRCALSSSGPGNYVTDVSPAAEPSYIAQFYVLANNSGGAATVFQALNAANATMINVAYDGTNFVFTTNGGGTASLPATANRWYRVRLNWRNNAPMQVQIQGNNQALANATLSAAPNAADVIDTARLGWISGGTTGTINTDVFESRRNTLPLPACKGDANGNGQIQVTDRGAITGEAAGTALAVGQPDANENGVIQVTDRGVVTGLVAAAAQCPTVAP
jgi:hypothetical protein